MCKWHVDITIRCPKSLQKWQKPQPALTGSSTGHNPTRYFWLILNPLDPVDKTRKRYIVYTRVWTGSSGLINLIHANPLHLIEAQPARSGYESKYSIAYTRVWTGSNGIINPMHSNPLTSGWGSTRYIRLTKPKRSIVYIRVWAGSNGLINPMYPNPLQLVEAQPATSGWQNQNVV